MRLAPFSVVLRKSLPVRGRLATSRLHELLMSGVNVRARLAKAFVVSFHVGFRLLDGLMSFWDDQKASRMPAGWMKFGLIFSMDRHRAGLSRGILNVQRS